MPRGGSRGKKNYKGRARHFTNEEEIKHKLEKEQNDRKWRRDRGEIDSDEEDEAEGKGAEGKGAATGEPGSLPPIGSGSESESEEEEEEVKKPKGVEDLIEISNPNRAVKQTKKVTALDEGASVQLSRREREELQKQQAQANYRKLHLAGKTEEAQADMARLALIRKQREEASKKREEERLAREAVKGKKK